MFNLKKTYYILQFWQNVLYSTFYFCQYDFYRFLHRVSTFWQNVQISTFWQNVLCCRNAPNFCYIKEGEKLGYHGRYLTKTRNTWYKIEKRKPAPILFGVFSRGRLKVIRNFTTAINFTCFHSFYPNKFGGVCNR